MIKSISKPIFTLYKCFVLVKVLKIKTNFVILFQAEGLTAIEAWVIVCVLFVFGALVGNNMRTVYLQFRAFFFAARLLYNQVMSVYPNVGISI